MELFDVIERSNGTWKIYETGNGRRVVYQCWHGGQNVAEYETYSEAIHHIFDESARPVEVMTLRNGADVLKMKKDASGFVVLARTDVDFVTWLVDNDGNAFHGHYFQTLAEASKDFDSR